MMAASVFIIFYYFMVCLLLAFYLMKMLGTMIPIGELVQLSFCVILLDFATILMVVE
jgi:hypothetical protein